MGKQGTRNLTEKTKRIVWAKSAGRCQFQNCNEPLIGHLVSGNLGANCESACKIDPLWWVMSE